MASTVWKGHLAFGLVSIPISLIRAARAERVNLHQLRRAAEAQKPRRADVIELPVPQGEDREPRRAEVREVPQSAPRDVPKAVERVSRAMVTPEGERPVPAAELVKGYEYQPDRWVLLEPDDIKQIAPKTSKVMQVVEFVRFGRSTRCTSKARTTCCPIATARNRTRSSTRRCARPSTPRSRRSPCMGGSTS